MKIEITGNEDILKVEKGLTPEGFILLANFLTDNWLPYGALPEISREVLHTLLKKNSMSVQKYDINGEWVETCMPLIKCYVYRVAPEVEIEIEKSPTDWLEERGFIMCKIEINDNLFEIHFPDGSIEDESPLGTLCCQSYTFEGFWYEEFPDKITTASMLYKTNDGYESLGSYNIDSGDKPIFPKYTVWRKNASKD